MFFFSLNPYLYRLYSRIRETPWVTRASNRLISARVSDRNNICGIA